jgi:hypothetical protein
MELRAGLDVILNRSACLILHVPNRGNLKSRVILVLLAEATEPFVPISERKSAFRTNAIRRYYIQFYIQISTTKIRFSLQICTKEQDIRIWRPCSKIFCNHHINGKATHSSCMAIFPSLIKLAGQLINSY